MVEEMWSACYRFQNIEGTLQTFNFFDKSKSIRGTLGEITVTVLHQTLLLFILTHILDYGELSGCKNGHGI